MTPGRDHRHRDPAPAAARAHRCGPDQLVAVVDERDDDSVFGREMLQRRDKELGLKERVGLRCSGGEPLPDVHIPRLDFVDGLQVHTQSPVRLGSPRRETAVRRFVWVGHGLTHPGRAARPPRPGARFGRDLRPSRRVRPTAFRVVTSRRVENSASCWAASVYAVATRRGPAARHRSRRSGSSRSRPIAAASASGSRGGTSRPASPMISGGPPWLVATTGTPTLIASSKTRPNDSGTMLGRTATLQRRS